MANDKDWQRRSDEWVAAMHKYRLQKERKLSKNETQVKSLSSAKNFSRDTDKRSKDLNEIGK